MPPTESGAMSDAPARHAADPDPPTPAPLPFPVVGIAASAGGVQALQAFFRAMPPDCGMAFVVLLNHAPRRGSQLPAILRSATSMPVLSPAGRITLEGDHVYVVAPHKLLAMNGSTLNVTAARRSRGRQPSVDRFFRTLAAAHRGHAFAVVLSGTGSDGAVGITRVKEQGGVSFAQLPQEAEFDDMPRSAITTGAVDWVLPAAEIAHKVVALWANARHMQLPDGAALPGRAEEAPTPEALRCAEDALRDVLMLLRTRTGHDFRAYKRATVLRRLERRMQVNGVPNLPAYHSFMQANPEESQALLKDLLIGVTNFFRDSEAFDQLQEQVMPGLVAKAEGAAEGLRVWVPGCSTGEEAYSLAIMLCEQAAQAPHAASIHVFATDIDEWAIDMARLGTYPGAIETDVSPVRLRRYFDKDGLQYRIRKEVREKVMFADHDILRDPPFSRLDLISCRNLLIYLNREVHADILRMFHFALKPGGYLFLGSSESADAASHLFTVVDKKNRIYRANVVTRPSRYVSGQLAGAKARTQSGGTAEPAAGKPAVTIGDLHRRLAEQYAPPSVLVDRDGHIVHIFGQAGRFLRYVGGTPTHELLAAIEPALRLELRTAMFQAVRTGKSVEARRVRVQRDGRVRLVTMVVRPVLEDGVEQPLSMVLFDEFEDSMAPELHVAEQGGRDPLVVQLEEELRRVKEQLQTTVEHSDTSTEELKASNEELQAINQELRSATEELETSKEELQSINEELVTVNNELKCKVEEAGKINDDLQNLIASTDIATVFVDRNMAIKRYTPQASRLFNLIPGDVGRSLLDITHKLDYPALSDDAADAFHSLKHIEREIRSQDGQWYLARVLPYRTTEDHRIDGAVLTFVDITGRRKAEELMRSVAEGLHDSAITTFAPLNQIQLSTELLRAPQGVERAVQAIRSAVQAQARIIDDLLDLSRARVGRLPLKRSLFDLRELVQSLVQGLQVEAADRRIALQLALPAQPLWLHADRARIEQLACNLLDNALKFTGARGRVDVSLAPAEGQACLEVTDSGRGIAPQRLPHVFELARPAAGARRRQSGLGLGLALVRHLAHAHGGRVEAASEGLRRGSRFTVWLPLARSTKAPR